MGAKRLCILVLLAFIAVVIADRNVIVKMRENREGQTTHKVVAGMTRSERRETVYLNLASVARASQSDLLQLLNEMDVPFKSFWISNSVYIPNCPESLYESLLKRSDVLEVRNEKFARLITRIESQKMPLTKSLMTSSSAIAPVWSVAKVRAPEAWNITRGEGITIANIDTGVRYTHEALVGSYRGNLGSGRFEHDYNWFDSRDTLYPNDGNGHGTHTMGTIAGSELSGIGIAPNAKWIAAKGCGTILCSEADLTASAEFVLCPTRLDGTNPDCSLGADVVSNSWGGGQGDNWYNPFVQAWRDAGIIPVFAQGNSGPGCETANSPGDMSNVIGVGATDSDDALARFSSRGPGPNAPGFSVLKPDISAPGAMVMSSYNSGDQAYLPLSGTSMACPAIAGVVGLMLSANEGLDYDAIYSILTSTAVDGLPAPQGGQESCGGVSYQTYPNNHYGFGRVDAYNSVVAARSR